MLPRRYFILIGAAIVGGGALLTGAGAAIGASSASSKYNKIVSELKDQNKEMSKNFKGQLEAVEKKYSSLIEKTVEEKEKIEKEKEEFRKEKIKLEKEKVELMRNSEGSQKELVDLMKKMAQAEEEAEERHRVLINKMEQEKKELKEKFEKDKKESTEKSEKEKENLKVLIQEMDEKNKKIIDKIEQEKKDLMEKFEEDKKELIKRSDQEKQELRELIKKMDNDRNETQLANQDLLTKMNTILNLPSVNAAIQNLQGADNCSEQPVTGNSQHSDTTATQGLHKTNGATQASNIATESSDELDDDIVVIPDPSSYIDEPMLSNYVSNNLSR